jgi:4-amino-4-deoxy-L-arabinose transferase-like glycosyltransferase
MVVFLDVVDALSHESLPFRSRAGACERMCDCIPGFRHAMSVRSRSRFDWFTPALLFSGAIYLYVNLFAFPNIPFLLSGDQVYFWMNAQRMLQGERIYRDFFQFTPPGTDLLYLGFFKLFSPHIWVTNAVVLVLGVILCWVCYEISKLIMGRPQAFLAASIFLVLI